MPSIANNIHADCKLDGFASHRPYHSICRLLHSRKYGVFLSNVLKLYSAQRHRLSTYADTSNWFQDIMKIHSFTIPDNIYRYVATIDRLVQWYLLYCPLVVAAPLTASATYHLYERGAGHLVFSQWNLDGSYESSYKHGQRRCVRSRIKATLVHWHHSTTKSPSTSGDHLNLKQFAHYTHSRSGPSKRDARDYGAALGVTETIRVATKAIMCSTRDGHYQWCNRSEAFQAPQCGQPVTVHH